MGRFASSYQPRKGASASIWNRTAHSAIRTARPLPSRSTPIATSHKTRRAVNGTARDPEMNSGTHAKYGQDSLARPP